MWIGSIWLVHYPLVKDTQLAVADVCELKNCAMINLVLILFHYLLPHAWRRLL
jgi:hypothetical protein